MLFIEILNTTALKEKKKEKGQKERRKEKVPRKRIFLNLS